MHALSMGTRRFGPWASLTANEGLPAWMKRVLKFVPWASSTCVICGCDLKERSYEMSAGRERGRLQDWNEGEGNGEGNEDESDFVRGSLRTLPKC